MEENRLESSAHTKWKAVVLMMVFTILGIIVFLWHNISNREREAKNQAVEILDAVLKNSTNVNLISESGVKIENLTGGNLSMAIMEEITYKISSLKMKENTVELELLFVYPDILALVEKFAEEEPVKKEFSVWLISSLKNQYPTKEKKLNLQMVENNDVFYLVVTNDLYDVLSGGIVSHTIRKEREVYDSWSKLQ